MTARRPPVTAVLGGTFDRLHVGHEALLSAAFGAARTVRIGVTTARYLREHPKAATNRIASYSRRASRLARFLQQRFPDRSFVLSPLNDRFGGSLRPGIDLLVLSEETRAGGAAVNRERRRRGLPALRILEVPRVYSDDGFPVSSTRIRSGEIDRRGRRRRPVHIALVSLGPPSLGRRVGAAVRSRFSGTRLRVDLVATRPVNLRPSATRSGPHLRSIAMAHLSGRDAVIAVARNGRGRSARIAVVAAPTAFGGSPSVEDELRTDLAERLRAAA